MSEGLGGCWVGGSGKVGLRLVAASKNMFQVDWSSIYFMVFHRL